MPDNSPAADNVTPEERFYLSRIMAINPADQPAVNKIALAYYRLERKMSEIAPLIGEVQKIALDQGRSVTVHPASLLGGVYFKGEEYYEDTGFAADMGKAMKKANDACAAVGLAHKKLTRVFCDLKIINEGGGGK
jgi:hypothetical protein